MVLSLSVECLLYIGMKKRGDFYDLKNELCPRYRAKSNTVQGRARNDAKSYDTRFKGSDWLIINSDEISGIGP